MDQIICNWTTYKGSHCKRTISINEINNKDDIQLICNLKFCGLHRELIIDYEKLNGDEMCDIFKEIKLVPRSQKHIKTIMKSLNNEDDIVEVYLAGGSIEEADISNIDYITLISDDSHFYYSPKRGQNRTKDLKIILKEYCKNNSLVNFSGTKYCEECYRKMKDVPRISLIN